MSIRIVCDGCDTILDPKRHEVAIEGMRADGYGGARPLPDGGFHWCSRCGKIAFQAVKDQR